MYSNRSIWLQIEEVVPKSSILEIGFRDEVKQTSKFARVLSTDSDFNRQDIIVIPVNSIRRHKIFNGKTNETTFHVLKDDVLMILENEGRNYTAIIDVKADKLCDEHRGVPKLEYV